MPNDNWLVEEEISYGPDFDIREVYVRLLQQMIDAIREQKSVQMGDTAEDIDIAPVYALPTVVYAVLDRPEAKSNKATVQFFCYRDRREFLGELAKYGDKEYLREFGLESAIEKSD